MKNLFKTFLMVVILCFGVVFGDMVRQIYFPSVDSKLVISPKSSPVVLSDTLPLENEGEIKIELVNGKQMVIISFKDLQYVTKKRKITKETIKNIESLFKRLED